MRRTPGLFGDASLYSRIPLGIQDALLAGAHDPSPRSARDGVGVSASSSSPGSGHLTA